MSSLDPRRTDESAEQRAIDPDVDLHVPQQRAELRRAPWATLAAISLGGVLGALARYGLTVAFPHPAGTFAWATFGVNVSGCLLIGVLMVSITEIWHAPALTRPFLGVGVLGGFTTFSAYIVDIHLMATTGAWRTALVYLTATPVAALLGVWAGAALTRRLARTAGAAHSGGDSR